LPQLKDASTDVATTFPPTTTLPLFSNERCGYCLFSSVLIDGFKAGMGGRKTQVGQEIARGYGLGYLALR